jgi:hypothetical protein
MWESRENQSGKTVVGTAEPVSPSRNFQSFGGVSEGFIGGPPAKKSGVFIFYPRVDALYLLHTKTHKNDKAY